MRQALSGMLWSKQYYRYDFAKWLKEHDTDPYLGIRKQPRNESWFHIPGVVGAIDRRYCLLEVGNRGAELIVAEFLLCYSRFVGRLLGVPAARARRIRSG